MPSTIETLKPLDISEYQNQTHAKNILDVHIRSTDKRGEGLQHILLHGPAGHGKTTLGQLIAKSKGLPYTAVNCARILSSRELVVAIISAPKGVILFDELHALKPRVQESMYELVDYGRVTYRFNKSVTMEQPIDGYTFIATTTETGLLTKPLRQRFMVDIELVPYEEEEIYQIIRRNTQKLGMKEWGGGRLIAQRCKLTPRIANKILLHCQDIVTLEEPEGKMTSRVVRKALENLGIGGLGLDSLDVRYLQALVQQDGTAGLEVLSMMLNNSKNVLVELEGWLMRLGMIGRSSKGRSILRPGLEYLISQEK